MGSSGMKGGELRLDRDLQNPLRPFAEEMVGLDNFIQRESVSDQLCASGCAQANWPLREDNDGIADSHRRRLRTGDSRRSDVGKHDRLLVRQLIGDFC